MSDIWDEALAEAYQSAPTDDAILPTLELRHPSFLDAEGNVTPVRVVRDGGNEIDLESAPEIYGWMLTLEAGAPLNGGEEVLFQACHFDFSLPDQTQQKLPEVDVEIANVTRIVSKYLDAAVELGGIIEVTYREFLVSDTSSPKYILGGLSMSRVKSDVFKVTGSASFIDLVNRLFPRRVYRPEDFPGLASTVSA